MPTRMPSSTQVMTGGLLVTVALVSAQAVAQLIDFHFFHLSLRVLDSDHHRSVFGALSIVAEALAAAAIGRRAVSERRLAWLAVAVVIGVLTVPRALMGSEVALKQYIVPILVAPLTVVFVVLSALTFRDARPVRFVIWGALVLLGCSFALHVVGPQADAGASNPYLVTHTWAYQGTGMLKHGAELSGWMLLAIGMVGGVLACQEDDLLTVHDIAWSLNLTQQTVCSWIDSGLLPAVHSGRRVRIKRSDFDGFLEASYIGSKSAR